jgi:hypothetical protein
MAGSKAEFPILLAQPDLPSSQEATAPALIGADIFQGFLIMMYGQRVRSSTGVRENFPGFN